MNILHALGGGIIVGTVTFVLVFCLFMAGTGENYEVSFYYALGISICVMIGTILFNL